MKRLNYFLFGVLIVLVAMLWLAAPARAEYLPDAEFLSKMEKLLALASEQSMGDLHLKGVMAGQTYREGDVAYFAVASDGISSESFMQLEKWRIQPDGSFLITFTKMWSSRAIRWTVRTNAEFRNHVSSREEKLVIALPEAIAASERAQELLRDHGRPVMIGGVAI